MKAQNQAGLGTGRLSLMHVHPRKLLTAPDTDVLVGSTAQRKVEKNVALGTGHGVS